MRPLLDKMEAKYGDKLFRPEETMWNVGQGAAMLAMNPGEYYSNQFINIVLSDNSRYEILKPNTPIRNWQHTCHFGIVDSSKEARFVFGGSPDIETSSEKYKTLSVPAYRFLQEKIILRSTVDENMVFTAVAGSDMRQNIFCRLWEYPQLKFYYKLPKGDLPDVE